MLLNRIFVGMFVIGIVVSVVQLVFLGDLEAFEKLVNELFNAASTGFELALFLTGALCLWLGIMAVGEKGGAVDGLTKIVRPLFKHLFPEISPKSPAVGSMMMNFSANMLGLDNAATPLGLKAMRELQEENPDKTTASNAQIMFLVLNTSGLTLIPVSILAYRHAAGASAPAEVFVPILLATLCSTLIGLFFVCIKQRISLFKPVVLLYLGVVISLISIILHTVQSSPDAAKYISSIGGNGFLLLVILVFFVLALRKKINIYETFIDGAKEGFNVAITIIPYLVAFLAAIALFRASGSLDLIMQGLKNVFLFVGLTSVEFIDAIPVGLMKPFSGSGSRALMVELFDNPNFGVDSFVGKLAATMQGSTETTFYVLALYFGSAGVKNTRYAAGAGLIADFAGIIGAIIIAYYFYSI